MKKIFLLATFILSISTFGQLNSNYEKGFKTGYCQAKKEDKGQYAPCITSPNAPLPKLGKESYNDGVIAGYKYYGGKYSTQNALINGAKTLSNSKKFINSGEIIQDRIEKASRTNYLKNKQNRGSSSAYNGSRYNYNEWKEFTVVLPGKIYFDVVKKEGVLLYETLFNDDLDASLDVYEGNAYEYLSTFTQELHSMANDLGYKEVREFVKGSMTNEIKYEFHIGYCPVEECQVIFGLVQDSFSRKLYEFELFCHNLKLADATKIINSIKIN